jgi:hypothetical protein
LFAAAASWYLYGGDGTYFTVVTVWKHLHNIYLNKNALADAVDTNWDLKEAVLYCVRKPLQATKGKANGKAAVAREEQMRTWVANTIQADASQSYPFVRLVHSFKAAALRSVVNEELLADVGKFANDQNWARVHYIIHDLRSRQAEAANDERLKAAELKMSRAHDASDEKLLAAIHNGNHSYFKPTLEAYKAWCGKDRYRSPPYRERYQMGPLPMRHDIVTLKRHDIVASVSNRGGWYMGWALMARVVNAVSEAAVTVAGIVEGELEVTADVATSLKVFFSLQKEWAGRNFQTSESTRLQAAVSK